MLRFFWKNILTQPGSPTPLGASVKKEGVNFALFSQHASHVTLGIFKEGKTKPFFEFELNPDKNKTGPVWHVLLENLPTKYFYGYCLQGPIGKEHHYDHKKWVSDPYSKLLNTPPKWGKSKGMILSQVAEDAPFDWEGDSPLHIPFEKLLIYEMHVRGLTQDPSSKVAHPGTYVAMIEKIEHLKQLGVNAVELLPIFEFDETENFHHNPLSGEKLFNYWGYSTFNFFTPMTRYATQTANAIQEFKMLVKALHKAGIEVILDVVFNHTSFKSPLRSIDRSVYYLIDSQGKDLNYSGCGNTVNCNHPNVADFIIEALRYWVVEMHVDGFRFDLASIFCREAGGSVSHDARILDAIVRDPLLKNTKLIAEPWDCGGLYQVGSFPGEGRFAEWNGQFRDVVRRFIKGTDGQVGAFAQALCGSEHLYRGRAPYYSINFITAHDGFTLADLVSYNEKNNIENGEHNRDGNNSNDSWNCDVEGATDKEKVLQLRERQMQNFILALGVSLGTPMILMGDEYGHSRQGNNNTYCQDNQKNYFLWDLLEKNQPLFLFWQYILNLRKTVSFFQRDTFFSEQDIVWHGIQPFLPNWDEKSRFLSYTLKDKQTELYIAFNANFQTAMVHLPPRLDGKEWGRLIDTSLPYPENFSSIPQKILQIYSLPPHSALLLA